MNQKRSLPARPQARQRATLRTGLSLIEVAISTLLVGILLVSSLKTVGAVMRQRASTADDLRARLLATQLMDEIFEKAYTDPDGLALFGPELLEPLTILGPRSSYDDVDDYHLWSRTPPQNRAGTALANMTGWQRSVTVAFVNPAQPNTTSLTDLGAKRITVEVRRNGTLLCSLQAIRTNY